MAVRFDAEALYRAAPVWAQNAIANVEGWRLSRRRYGGSYPAILRDVEQRASLTGDALTAFQQHRLASHLAAAAATPFWRRRFTQHGVDPRGSNPFAELAKLPVLTKLEVQRNVTDIVNPSLPRGRLQSAHTSGTTGGGLVLYETREAEQERWAVWWRYRRAFGLTLDTRSGHFGGRSVVPVEQHRPPYWRENRFGGQLLLSAYHLSERTVEGYWRALDDWKAEWLHGYPSFVAQFAQLCVAAKLPPLPSVRCVTTAAENLLAGQRRLIEGYFRAPLHQHYGLAESVANVSERPDGSYRVDEDFALTEFVPMPEAGEERRVVGTNWSNPAFPLLRYDTGDVATIDAAEATRGGVWRRVQAIDGRQEDFVILPSGARVGRLDHIFKDLVNIREAQIHQPAEGRLVFRIVRGDGYEDARDEARLLHEARLRLGHDIGITLDYVTEIPRTRRGKLRFVVSDIRGSSITFANTAAELA